MQTSSTLFLLANFLAAALTAGISALGQSPSAALLETPPQNTILNQRTPILSTNRGSGRINSDQPEKATQLGNTILVWRGSGRTQSDPEEHRADASLAWRGSGRINSNLAKEDRRRPVDQTVSWRGSGRLDPNQQTSNVS